MHRISCPGSVAQMKMDDDSDEQISIFQYQRVVNGGRTEALGSESSVFLFKNINTKM